MFGFITTEEGDEVFFHKREFKEQGILSLEFEVVDSIKGRKAVNIRRAKPKDETI